MGKLITLCIAAIMAVSMWADRLQAPKVVIQSDLSHYKYAYVIPTSAITSNSGTYGSVYGGNFGLYGGVQSGPTKTVSPAELISGQLMQRGYTILPSVEPALAAETMIVSYGNVGRRELSAFAYATCIVIQFTDAATHEKVATFESEGCGSDETEDIHQAIHRAFEVYDYSQSPCVKLKIEDATRMYTLVRLYNMTPDEIKSYTIRLTYLKGTEVMHEQYYTENTPITPGDSKQLKVKCDKKARSMKYAVKAEIVSFN